MLGKVALHMAGRRYCDQTNDTATGLALARIRLQISPSSLVGADREPSPSHRRVYKSWSMPYVSMTAE